MHRRIAGSLEPVDRHQITAGQDQALAARGDQRLVEFLVILRDQRAEQAAPHFERPPHQFVDHLLPHALGLAQGRHGRCYHIRIWIAQQLDQRRQPLIFSQRAEAVHRRFAHRRMRMLQAFEEPVLRLFRLHPPRRTNTGDQRVRILVGQQLNED